VELDSNKRDRLVEQVDHVQKSARDVFCDDHGNMLVLWVTALLDIPVLNGPDDV
jgi:hypothetical protein